MCTSCGGGTGLVTAPGGQMAVLYEAVPMMPGPGEVTPRMDEGDESHPVHLGFNSQTALLFLVALIMGLGLRQAKVL